MSYYPEPNSHIRGKVKVVPNLLNYTIQEELDPATGANTSNLASKNDFIALKAEIDKLYISKLNKSN